MVNGQPVYFKRDRTDWGLDYHAANRQWMVRPLVARGTDRSNAYVNCAAGVSLESCGNKWMVAVNKKFVEQQSVKVGTSQGEQFG